MGTVARAVGRSDGDDEVDLAALVRRLWTSRYMIGVITFIGAVLAGVYAYAMAPVVYETRAVLLPPKAGDLADYNLAHHLSQSIYPAPEFAKMLGDTRQPGSETDQMTTDEACRDPSDDTLRLRKDIPRLTPCKAYRVFQQRLTSLQFRAEFLKSVHAKHEQAPQPDDAGARRTLRGLAIQLPRPGHKQVVVTWRGEDPALVAGWANQYIQEARHSARAELRAALASELKMRIHSMRMLSEAIRKIGQTERRFQMVRLREALQIARAAGLEEVAQAPRLIAPRQGNGLYLLGSQALQSQLQALSQREVDDPFLPELLPVRQAQLLLERAAAARFELRVATLDAPARVPKSPVQPQGPLIMLLGSALGLTLGVLAALLPVRRRAAF